MENFCGRPCPPLEKCVRHSLKIWAPQKTPRPLWFPKLVTNLSYLHKHSRTLELTEKHDKHVFQRAAGCN